MTQNKSNTNRKIGVVINMTSLLVLMIISEYTFKYDRNTVLLIIGLAALVLILISFIFTYWKTRLWHFVHKPIRKLDERELQITGNLLRIAYAIFTVIALSILLLSSLMEMQVSIVTVSALIYFSHILPATVIAWKGWSWV